VSSYIDICYVSMQRFKRQLYEFSALDDQKISLVMQGMQACHAGSPVRTTPCSNYRFQLTAKDLPVKLRNLPSRSRGRMLPRTDESITLEGIF
jgi:hypothetical protein